MRRKRNKTRLENKKDAVLGTVENLYTYIFRYIYVQKCLCVETRRNDASPRPSASLMATRHARRMRVPFDNFYLPLQRLAESLSLFLPLAYTHTFTPIRFSLLFFSLPLPFLSKVQSPSRWLAASLSALDLLFALPSSAY